MEVAILLTWDATAYYMPDTSGYEAVVFWPSSAAASSGKALQRNRWGVFSLRLPAGKSIRYIQYDKVSATPFLAIDSVVSPAHIPLRTRHDLTETSNRKKDMTAHSVLVGGSIADRRIHCPASFQEQLKAPPGLTSVYAEHGTAMHEGMAHWLQNPDDDLVGQIFNEHVVTQEDIDTLLTPAWDSLVELQEFYGGGFKVTGLEVRVAFPGIAGAFGTVDVILESKTHFIVADFKFGAGVYVPVKYDDGKPNSQLLFYLSGAAKKAKKRTLVIAIVQPTFPPGLSHTIVSHETLKAFEATLHEAISLATSPNPPRARGDWCRFAPCRATCSLWTGPLLDLTAIGRPPARQAPPTTDWGVFLANAKRLVDSALQYQKEIDAALLEHLKAGGTAPGFDLKKQVKNRKWLDDVNLVARTLEGMGLPEDKIWQHKLQTFAVTDAAAKKLGVTIPDTLRPRPQSDDLVLTYEGDPNAVELKQLTADFSAALKKLAAS